MCPWAAVIPLDLSTVWWVCHEISVIILKWGIMKYFTFRKKYTRPKKILEANKWAYLNTNKNQQLNGDLLRSSFFFFFAAWQRDEQVMPASVCRARPAMLSFTLYVLLPSPADSHMNPGSPEIFQLPRLIGHLTAARRVRFSMSPSLCFRV